MMNIASALVLVLSSFLLGSSTTSAAATPAVPKQLDARDACIPVSGGPCQDSWPAECDYESSNVVCRWIDPAPQRPPSPPLPSYVIIPDEPKRL